MVLQKNVLVTLLFAVFVPAIAFAATPFDACGKDDTQYKVSTDKKHPLPSSLEPGAQIVFIEALDGDFITSPTARFAIDGNWVGANRGPSYFVVSVEPGEHHLCARRQSSAKSESDNAGATTIHVEPGSVYYVEFRIKRNEVGDASMRGGSSVPGESPGSMIAKDHPTIDTVEFKSLSAEEVRSRVGKLPMSTFTVKK
jgi:hypothetical protein